MVPDARPADTPPEIWAMVRAGWREMTPTERLVTALSMTDDVFRWHTLVGATTGLPASSGA